ncbi:MAG: MATE family efflux transporter [SAR86 cluster bacterium]|nr:MATE family efflux transporter [SAR86 cluster bacterium]
MEQTELKKLKFRFSLPDKFIVEFKSYSSLAVPMFLSNLAGQLMGLSAIIQLGLYSSQSLAGALIANSIWFPTFLGLGGMIFYVTAMVAQLHGADKDFEIGPLIRQALWLCIPLFFIIYMILSLAPQILVAMNVAEDVILSAREYLSGLIFAIPAILLMQPLRSFSEGIKKPLPITLISYITLVISVFGNYCLIFGNFGLPELGAKGAGLSIAIGTWSALIITLIYIKINISYQKGSLFLRFDMPSIPKITEILKGGLPVGASNFIELSMFSGASLILGKLGSDVIAAHGIALNIASLAFMIPLSIGLAAAVRVGNKVGAKEFLSAKYSAFSAIKLGVIFGLITCLILLFGSKWIVMTIYTSDPNIISITVVLLLFAALFQIADAVTMCSMGSLRGYKDTLGPMFIMVIAYWVVGLPMGYSLAVTDFWSFKFGASGMWIGMTLGLFVASILMPWRLHHISQLK